MWYRIPNVVELQPLVPSGYILNIVKLSNTLLRIQLARKTLHDNRSVVHVDMDAFSVNHKNQDLYTFDIHDFDTDILVLVPNTFEPLQVSIGSKTIKDLLVELLEAIGARNRFEVNR